MTTRTFLLAALIVAIPALGFAGDFKRPLPDVTLLQKLTPNVFPDCDAVIVLKEQGYQMLESTFDYQGSEYKGLSTFTSKTIIAKLLTPAGVERYGSFEFAYGEWFGDELPNQFAIKVRVRKADGAVEELESDDMEPQVSRRDSDGEPIERKVVFKIPNLAVGDVLQYESEFRETFTLFRSAMFFFQEPDPVLFSNLFITLPASAEAEYISIPQASVGEPKVQDLNAGFGAGDTRFWSLRNLAPIPKEPFARPFSERAWLAAFVVKKFGINEPVIADWSGLGARFYDRYLDEDQVEGERLTAMGLPLAVAPGGVTKGLLDSVYAALRTAVAVTRGSMLVPISRKLDVIFKDRKGDASDLAYAMYTILQRWNVPGSIVWIRDRRKGGYEMNVPTTMWFDRLGVVATVEGKECVYDFDPSAPVRYESPWYLTGVSLPFVGEESVTHRVVVPAATQKADRGVELHRMDLRRAGGLMDSCEIELEGSPASKFRLDTYGGESAEFTRLERKLAEGVFLTIDTSTHNNVIVEPVVRVTVVGESAGRTDSVKGLRTVTLANGLLKGLRDGLRAPKRWSDVQFNAPQSIRLRWEIRLPAGTSLEKGGPSGTVTGPRGSQLTCTSAAAADLLTVEGTLHLPSVNIPRAEYPELIAFLEKAIQTINAELVFRQK